MSQAINTNSEIPTPKEISAGFWELFYEGGGETTRFTGKSREAVYQKAVEAHVKATRHIQFLKSAKITNRTAPQPRELSGPDKEVY